MTGKYGCIEHDWKDTAESSNNKYNTHIVLIVNYNFSEKNFDSSNH